LQNVHHLILHKPGELSNTADVQEFSVIAAAHDMPFVSANTDCEACYKYQKMYFALKYSYNTSGEIRTVNAS